LKDYLFI